MPSEIRQSCTTNDIRLFEKLANGAAFHNFDEHTEFQLRAVLRNSQAGHADRHVVLETIAANSQNRGVTAVVWQSANAKTTLSDVMASDAE